MQLLRQCAAVRALGNEIFDFIRLLDRTTFKSTRVMKDILGIALENELVVDVVQSALRYIRR
jgi:hypothetical protein